MARSRAFNRFNRFTAKRRRKALRSEVLSVRDEIGKGDELIDHSQELRQQEFQREALMDFIEPELGT